MSHSASTFSPHHGTPPIVDPKTKLRRLMQLRRETDDTFRKIEEELRESLREFQEVSERVDTAAFMAGIFSDIGKLAYKGMKTLALSGHLLKEANQEIGQEALKFAVKPPAELIGEHWSHHIAGDDNVAIGFAKTFLGSYFDLTSPSFWASVYANLRRGRSWGESVTTTPGDDLNNALINVRRKHADILRALDVRIHELQRTW